MLGGLLALVSAALFGLNNAATRRGVITGTVLQALAITVPLGVPLFLLACLLTGSLAAVTSFSWTAVLWLSLAGILHFVLGRYCNYRAIAAIGNNLAGPVQQWEVLVSLSLALLLLGERLDAIKLAAIALLILGPAIAARVEAGSRSANGRAAIRPVAFEPRYGEGYTFALLSTFGYGLSPILVRAGLEQAGLSASFAAGLVSYLAAAVVIVVVVLVGGHWRHVNEVQREPRNWFLFAGVLVFISQLFRYMALALVPVSVVAPIMRLQVMFRLYFGWWLTREHEVFERSVILGTVISTAGAILLTVPTEALLAVLPLPDGMKAVLSWSWP